MSLDFEQHQMLSYRKVRENVLQMCGNQLSIAMDYIVNM